MCYFRWAEVRRDSIIQLERPFPVCTRWSNVFMQPETRILNLSCPFRAQCCSCYCLIFVWLVWLVGWFGGGYIWHHFAKKQLNRVEWSEVTKVPPFHLISHHCCLIELRYLSLLPAQIPTFFCQPVLVYLTHSKKQMTGLTHYQTPGDYTYTNLNCGCLIKCL